MRGFLLLDVLAHDLDWRPAIWTNTSRACWSRTDSHAMTVYVDDMRARYGRMVMCHMIADTDEELRAMADKIGVRQKWHQGDHFDICLEKRALAVAAGAIELTQRQLGAMVIRKRRTGELGSPDGAVAWLREKMRNSA